MGDNVEYIIKSSKYLGLAVTLFTYLLNGHNNCCREDQILFA